MTMSDTLGRSNEDPPLVRRRDLLGEGESWTPPAVVGPLITFRGKQASASALDDEERAAREAGFQRGRSEGLAAAAMEVAQRLADLDARRQLLEGLVQQIAAPLERYDDETAAEMANLALVVGAQLARRELSIDPRQVLSIIRECIDSLPSAVRVVRIRLAPADASVLRESLHPDSEPCEVQVVADPRITRGGCIVEADASRIDAQFESRVAAAVATVMGEQPIDRSAGQI
jgi:flagellar assembly protein FliH